MMNSESRGENEAIKSAAQKGEKMMSNKQEIKSEFLPF
jgi:hypothetical protein